ncbi:transposase [Polaromonas sp. CG_9.11]|nr:IS5 family transposase [Polaromonas sp. CG_9.11]MBG6075738.1 transposase [Polaromonas sp. CG_9.11]
MELTIEQFKQIEDLLGRQRGNVSMSNVQVLNGILHMAANGCKWRALPARYGNWHAIYTCISRWRRAVVLDRIFEHLQRRQLVDVRIESICLDSNIIKVPPPDGTGAQKNGPQAHGKSRGDWTTKLHLVAADDRNVVAWSLTGGQAGDAPEGRCLAQELGSHEGQVALMIDSAYQDNATRELACSLGLVPVMQPNAQPRQP